MKESVVTGTSAHQSEFSELMKKHAGIVWKVAYAWCRATQDREDLAQEITLQLWRAFPRYDRGRSFPTWMYRIALNVAITSARKRGRMRVETLSDCDEPAAVQVDTKAGELLEELFQIIDQLEPTEKALLLLWLDGYSYASIAEIIGITESNVATRLSRLRAKLREQSK